MTMRPRAPSDADRDRELDEWIAETLKRTGHRCPERCHRCPLMGGAVMPGCMGGAIDSACTCPPIPRPRAGSNAAIIIEAALALALNRDETRWKELTGSQRMKAMRLLAQYRTANGSRGDCE